MFSRLRRTITSIRQYISDFLTPFANIASELRRMNNLKELEMAERLNPKTGEREPIIPVTESPGRNDTEVFFGEEKPRVGVDGMRAELSKLWEGEGVEDE